MRSYDFRFLNPDGSSSLFYNAQCVNDEQAKQAIATLQGKVLGTNPLNIKEAKEGGPKTW